MQAPIPAPPDGWLTYLNEAPAVVAALLLVWLFHRYNLVISSRMMDSQDKILGLVERLALRNKGGDE